MTYVTLSMRRRDTVGAMEIFVAVCGFFGAWLLVAGPIYQAALELRDEDIEQENINEVRGKVQRSKTSPWWWLLPPAKIVLERRRGKQFRAQFLAALPDEDVEALVSFLNKATGWLFVAGGGLLLAIKETYELTEQLHRSSIYFWLAIGAMTIVCLGNTAYRIARSERLLSRNSRPAKS